nr:MAG TPA: hypothetical protein [Caudoviricetes sp.]
MNYRPSVSPPFDAIIALGGRQSHNIQFSS